MAVVLTGPVTQVNTSLAGTQGGPEIAATPNGGFIIGWTSQFNSGTPGATDAFVQTYTGAGQAVGANVQIGDTSAVGGEEITDIEVLPTGEYAVAWITSGGNLTAYGQASLTSAAAVQTFNWNGVAQTGDVLLQNVNLANPFDSQVDLIADGNASFTVVYGADFDAGSNQQVRSVSLAMNGSLSDFRTLATTVDTEVLTVATNGEAGGVVFATNGPAGAQIWQGAGGAPFAYAAHAGGAGFIYDIEQVQPGLYASGEGYGTLTGGRWSNAQLGILHGQGQNVSFYDRGSASFSANNSFTDVSIVALDDGRVATAYVAGTGVSRSVVVTVFNLATGSSESMTLNVPSGSSSIDSIEMAELADGRLALSWIQGNGFVGGELYMAIFDPRTAAVTVTGTFLADVFVGTGFDDVLSGFAGSDTLTGGAGMDLITGGSGADVLDGGGQSGDRVSYINAGSGVKVELSLWGGSTASAFNTGDAAGDLLQGFTEIEGSQFGDEIRILGGISTSEAHGLAGDDILTALPGASVSLFGGSGDDLLLGAGTLDGGSGNDRLTGRGSADQMYGGTGDDVLEGNAGNDLMDGQDGADRLLGALGNDSLFGGQGIDQLIGGQGDDEMFGGTEGDKVSGHAGNDAGYGQAGDDWLYGAVGDDLLDGGDGNDWIYGDTGFDTLIGGAGADTAYYGSNTTRIQIVLGAGYQMGYENDEEQNDFGDDEPFIILDTLSGIENIIGGQAGDYIEGDAGDNVLDGFRGDDQLMGGDGIDTLIGGLGDDVLQGGARPDTLLGGDGVDTANYEDMTTTVIVNLFTGANGGAAAGDFLASIENVVGGSATDFLTGDRLDNFLFGGIGNDTLTGGRGTDVLFGENGNDNFVYTSILDGGGPGDTVADFQLGSDRFHIQGAAFGGTTSANFASRFVWNTTGLATAAGPQFIFQSTGENTGTLYYDSNGTSAGGSTILANIIFASGQAFDFGADSFTII